HGGAHGLQRILGAAHEGGWGMPADALQRRQHLGDDGAALLQRAAQYLLALVERRQAFLRLGGLLLHAADAGGGVDDLLIELAPVVADRLDLALELDFILQRLALLGAERLELLVAFLEGVEAGGRTAALGRRRRFRARRLRRRADQAERQNSQHRRGQDDDRAQRG